jgi:Mg-chelatase subunit ChlD
MKTMETESVYNLIILDESGSMEHIKKPIMDGFNEVVQNIKGIEIKFPEQKHFISFVTFNGIGIKTHLHMEAVKNLKPIDEKSYNPDSMTPLYDAIGLSTLKLKNEIGDKPNTNVLVTILTDGMENASSEFNGEQIYKIISDLKAQGWTFTYIGANHDVEGAAMKISITNTMTFTAEEDSVKHMFGKENLARERYSNNIRNKQNKDKDKDYYKDL